jgi:iron complex transport system substrate-binding protein
VDVYYQIWDRPLMTVSGEHLASDVLRLCGGRNVFAGLPALASPIGIEAVLQRDPRVIVVAAGPGEAERLLAPWRHWPGLAAVRGDHLYAIDRDLLVRHTPRILDGARQLCRLLDQARPE